MTTFPRDTNAHPLAEIIHPQAAAMAHHPGGKATKKVATTVLHPALATAVITTLVKTRKPILLADTPILPVAHRRRTTAIEAKANLTEIVLQTSAGKMIAPAIPVKAAIGWM